MTKVEKLTKLLELEYNIKLDSNSFVRVRAGYLQRALGAWSWSMRYLNENSCDFGSQDSITEILKHKDKIVISGNEIIIEHNYKN